MLCGKYVHSMSFSTMCLRHIFLKVILVDVFEALDFVHFVNSVILFPFSWGGVGIYAHRQLLGNCSAYLS